MFFVWLINVPSKYSGEENLQFAVIKILEYY